MLLGSAMSVAGLFACVNKGLLVPACTFAYQVRGVGHLIIGAMAYAEGTLINFHIRSPLLQEHYLH